MLALLLACVAGVGTAQFTVALNVGTVEEKSDVRYVRVPDHKDLGSKHLGYLPFETGTALFGLIMTHKHCEMERPLMNMLETTIQELAQALNYQTDINNEVSKPLESDATALSERFQAKKRNDERDVSIVEQIMAFSASTVLSKYSMDQLKDAAVMKTAVDEVLSQYQTAFTSMSTLLPNQDVGAVSGATYGPENMISMFGKSAQWSIDFCTQPSVPSCMNEWVEIKQPSANLPKLVCTLES